MKKSIFLIFAAILCATSASAWSYKSAANSWKASTSGFTNVTMNSGNTMDVVMLKDVGDGVNICQNDNGTGHTLYCKWTKTSGDIFRGTARWNGGLYSDETVVVPGGKVYITVGSGTQVQMTAGTNYTYTADVTFSTTGQSYTISGGTVNGAKIENQNSMPSGGKPASLTMKNSYTSKNAGSVHIVFDLRTNTVTETAASEPEQTVTLYFVNHPEWTNLKAHVWDNNNTPYKEWNNSESMTNTGLDKDGYAVYSYTFPSKYTNIIFKGDGQQTQDNVAAYDAAKPYFCDDKWYASLAEIPALGVVVTYDYYVIGTVNGWALKDASYGMTDDNADGVYEKEVALAIGKHELKINNGTWDNANTFGHDNLSVAYEGVSRGSGEGDNNIVIDLAEAKTVTVKLDKNTKKITLDGLTEKAPEPTFDYYIVGSFNGDNPKKAENGMTLDGTAYKATVTLAAGDHTLKVTDGTWDKTWGASELGAAYEEVSNPNDGYNNIKITLTAEKTITVIFDATAGKITFEGLTEKAPAEPAKCYLMGIGGDWTTGIEMEEDGDQFKLLCQPIAEGEQFKFKHGDTWSDGVENYDFPGIKWVDDDNDGNSNITLPAGNYDFYYKKNENKVWIGVCTPATPTPDYTRTVTEGNYGTICLPYASSNYTGMELYEVSWLKKSGETPVNLYLDQLEVDAQLEAGKPYIFRATSTELTVTYTDDAPVADPVAGKNGLTGSFDAISAGGVLTGNYVVAQNKFWTATATAYADENRAYIDKEKVPDTEQKQIPGRRRVSLGAAGENAETGIDNIITTDAPVKVIENGQLIIIRNGEKFNVQGQKL